MKFAYLSVCFACFFAVLSFGQNTDSTLHAKESKSAKKIIRTPDVLEMDGIAEVAGHYGKKLIKEIGSRINLLDADTEAKDKIKVVMKVGPFRIERYE